uniref:Uncharacterized protein n=2 Tax=Pyxicephalus adspersus TaxID=30357 RepID=A0AAV3AGA7_PYXAD|nr:TPA: hypothetical protein GDO54_006381 [Pyxicephalus adspersus]
MCLKELEDVVKQKVNHQLSTDSEAFLDDLSDLDSSTGGSDSSDSNGPPAHLMEMVCKVKPKKKMLKSKRERNSQRKQFEPPNDNESTKGKEKTDAADQPGQTATVKQNLLEKPKNTGKASKRNKTTLSKKQRKPLLQDLDAKKVSVIYLVFNANGEVISTKSHSYANTQNVMELTSSLKGFSWNRPLPIFKNILPSRFPFNGVMEPGCFFIIPSDVTDTPLSNTLCHGYESGDGVQKSVKVPMSSLYSEGGKLSSGGLWVRESLEKETGSSVLPGAFVRHGLSPPAVRMSGSAPPLVHRDMEVLSNLYNSGNDVRWRQKDSSSMLLNREICSEGCREKEGTVSIRHEKGEISLPAVTNSTEVKLTGVNDRNFLHPTPVTKIRHIQNTFPKTAAHSQTSNSSGITSVTLPKKGRGQSGNELLQKRKLGRLFSPHPQETQADRQYSTLPVNTWKDVLIGLQGSGDGTSGGATPLHFRNQPVATAPKENTSKHRTNNSGNTSRKPRLRISLAPLKK